MKNLDFRSVLIGILGSVLTFVLLGMHVQDENLGDIRVKSITIESGDNAVPFQVLNKNGEWAAIIGFDEVDGGLISTYSISGSELVAISATKGDDGSISTFSNNGTRLVTISATDVSDGLISTYSNDGSELVTISVTKGDDGSMSIFNRHGKRVVNMQGGKNADGVIAIYDRYGDLGWGESGKQ